MTIGITGTNGSGKSELAKYLVYKYDFKHISARDILIEVLDNLNLEPTRYNLIETANYLRRLNGPQFLEMKMYELGKNYYRCVIESLRNEIGVKELKKNDDFILIALDAPASIRYERIIKRESETDKISYEKFIEQDCIEIYGKDPNQQNLKKCIELADYKLYNNMYTSVYHKDIDNMMLEIFANYKNNDI